MPGIWSVQDWALEVTREINRAYDDQRVIDLQLLLPDLATDAESDVLAYWRELDRRRYGGQLQRLLDRMVRDYDRVAALHAKGAWPEPEITPYRAQVARLAAQMPRLLS